MKFLEKFDANIEDNFLNIGNFVKNLQKFIETYERNFSEKLKQIFGNVRKIATNISS